MSLLDPERTTAIRAAMQAHLSKRLHVALSKITGADTTAENKRKKQREFYQLESLFETGAACIGQIQMATHIVKGVHPDPKVKKTSNLNVDCAKLPALPLVGSHVLPSDKEVDATGNGAFNKQVYELFLLLSITFEGRRLLDLLRADDADAVAALSTSPAQATELARTFADIEADRCEKVASHVLAKQLYWPVGNNPHDDAEYHLLAPLYPTSLVHRLYQALQDDRFSDGARAARDARKARSWHERPVREYPQLAIQQLGGTKPQNISQLNSERRGNNMLLASLPPIWQSADVSPVFGVESLFKVFGRRAAVRRLTTQLSRFLQGDPARNLAARRQRDDWLAALLDELMLFSAEQHTLPPGWTDDERCMLRPSHRAWLDPDGVEAAPPDLIEDLAGDFANWLNHELRDPLPMGDAEYLHWRKQATELFQAMEREDAL